MDEHFLGETYENLLKRDATLLDVISGFDLALEYDTSSKLALVGKKKFSEELHRNLEAKIEYLKMVEPVIESAYESQDLSDKYYNDFKRTLINLKDKIDNVRLS